jgi:NAD(P)-dependent dehydrogenase (short-subunit alcohol dehydrogenase family)
MHTDGISHVTRVDGKTVLVTGSTDGVGRVVAEQLAQYGARVLVHGRNLDRGQSVVAKIQSGGGTADFLPADLSSLAEVRRLADAVRQRTNRLDILINNAGTTSTSRQLSADGYELCFAVNYLAGFLLTLRLLPLILKSTPARIINVASAGQQALDFDDIMLSREFSSLRAYRQSKLAQIIFTMDLTHEIASKGVTVNTLHPATCMNTTMVRRAGIAPVSTVAQGADAILSLATSPTLKGCSGLYFNGLHEATANAQAYDEQIRRRLRNVSLKMIAAAGPTDRAGMTGTSQSRELTT